MKELLKVPDSESCRRELNSNLLEKSLYRRGHVFAQICLPHELEKRNKIRIAREYLHGRRVSSTVFRNRLLIPEGQLHTRLSILFELNVDFAR